MLRQVIVSSLLAISPFSLSAAVPGAGSMLIHAPLAFARDVDGSLVARQGQYRLAVESGRTTVTVGDRRRGRTATVTTRLAGAAALARPEGEDPLQAKASYFLGADPAQWRTGAPLFRRAVERNVYSGIDLVFHGDNGSLEYDFQVRPGADPRRISLDVSGASAMRVEADGALAIATPAGEIRWRKPEVYQWKDGVREAVAGAFALHGRRVTFAIGAYDRRRELVIDPTLAYATYFGGSDNEGGRGLAVDSSGNIYITGFTYSTNLHVTSGAFQTAYHGGTAASYVGGDAFVAKYTPAGALVYVTYLGGSSDDCGNAIAVDSAGNAYITGFTDSTNFPTTKGALSTVFNGLGTSNQYSQDFGDAFVTKLNPSGSALVYSTFLGGANDDVGLAIAVDGSGNAYVGGATLSTNFPTVTPFQATFHGAGGGQPFCCGSNAPFLEVGDGFVAKLNPAGSALLFSTYLGGSLDDTVSSLALDSSDNVYAGGNTMSTDFPTLNPYQKTFGGAASGNNQPVISTGDGFVAKFSSSGVLQYSTYLGGNGDDAVMGIAVDSTGAAYVTGFTSSSNFPVSANAAQKKFTGPAGITGDRGFVWGDAFVSKVAPSGSSLVWSTYLGGTQDDAGMAIALDSGLNAIVGGFANSTDFPITSNAQQPVFSGNGPAGFTDPTGDAFVAKISADGTTFDYVSYYGGNSSDAITSVAIDGQGRVIVEGATTSTNLPGTAGGAQPNFGGNGANTTETMGDAFMAIFAGIATAPSLTPTISAVVNDASFMTALAPGSVAAIFGTGLPASASAGATVGGQAAVVLLSSATQWNVVIPNNAALGSSSVQVGNSAAFPITLSQYAPALFSAAASGQGAALVSPSASSYQPGETISIYATGLGTAGANGQPAQLPSVTIGGTQVTVFSVAANGTPGEYQVTIQIPPSTAAGNPAVVLSIGGLSSQSLTLPVGAITGTTIAYVENAASYLPGFSQGSWVTITGANLAGTTRIWTAADFSGANLPTTLSQVSVTIDGKPAYVYFISPTQINVLAPADTAQGPVPVQVTYAGNASNTLMATIASFSPALFMFSPDGGKYVAAVRIDGQYIGPTSLYPGATSSTGGPFTIPANVGDTLELYGTGFGPTNPTTNFAQTFSGAPVTTNTVTATIGGVAANVSFAGLVAPGEYQFNIVVPNVPAGDNLVVLKVNGLTTQANAYLTVQ